MLCRTRKFEPVKWFRQRQANDSLELEPDKPKRRLLDSKTEVLDHGVKITQPISYTDFPTTHIATAEISRSVMPDYWEVTLKTTTEGPDRLTRTFGPLERIVRGAQDGLINQAEKELEILETLQRLRNESNG